MIGLLYLVVIAVWLVLTCLMLAYLVRRIWRSIRQKTGARWNFVITTCFALVTLAWLAASFWYGGGRTYYYDAEVNRLCAIDGGVRVYETVRLPVERFDKYGQVRIPSRRDAKIENDYFYDWDTITIQSGNPDMLKSNFRIVRMSDGKTLGTATSYARRGGVLPGLLSSFRCPPRSDITDLEKQVFIQ